MAFSTETTLKCVYTRQPFTLIRFHREQCETNASESALPSVYTIVILTLESDERKRTLSRVTSWFGSGNMSPPRKKVTAAALLVLSRNLKKKKRRQIWVRKWISKRDEEGLHAKLLQELLSEDDKSFQNFLRMSREDYDYLLEKVTPKIIKSDTHLRKAIPPSVRLTLTLRFLASGK